MNTINNSTAFSAAAGHRPQFGMIRPVDILDPSFNPKPGEFVSLKSLTDSYAMELVSGQLDTTSTLRPVALDSKPAIRILLPADAMEALAEDELVSALKDRDRIQDVFVYNAGRQGSFLASKDRLDTVRENAKAIRHHKPRRIFDPHPLSDGLYSVFDRQGRARFAIPYTEGPQTEKPIHQLELLPAQAGQPFRNGLRGQIGRADDLLVERQGKPEAV